jgi:sugar/nucleoside kinase (ribokinase family)
MTCSMAPNAAASEASDDLFSVASIGNIATDITIELEGRLPTHTGDHRRANYASIDLGGSLNVLIAASRLGARTAPVGFVPEERDGARGFLFNAIRDFGFSSIDGVVPKAGFTSPLCSVLVEPGLGSTFVATNETPDPNASQEVFCDLPQAMRTILTRSRVVCVDGYAVAGEPGLVTCVLDECDAMLRLGMELWYDPQAVGASRTADPVFREMLSRASAVALTENEAREMVGMGVRAIPDVEDVISALTKVAKRAHLIVVKRGSKGCCVAHRPDRDVGAWVVNYVRGFDVGKARDESGCGDSFLGGLIAGLTTHELSIVDSCVLANAVGAATAMRVGAGVQGVAARQDVEEVLSLNGRTLGLRLTG